MNEEEENISGEIIIEPTCVVVAYLFECGDITEQEYIKYLKDPSYTPRLNPDHEE